MCDSFYRERTLHRLLERKQTRDIIVKLIILRENIILQREITSVEFSRNIEENIRNRML